MYVLIDRKQMAITHKHERRDVLGNLAWIECVNDAITLPLGNAQHFNAEFDATQLRSIYRNATGEEIVGVGYALAKAVHDMAMRLPNTKAELLETAAQRGKVMDGDKHCYTYVYGAYEPEQQEKGWTPDPLRTQASPVEIAAAKQYQQAPAPAQSDHGPSNVFSHEHKPMTTPRTAGAPSTGHRQSGVREVVYKVADKLWEEAGKPSDLKVVLDLRKKIMTVLEAEHQVKRTTSSTTLGAWQKERIG